jgi:hypothetical protein
MGKATTFEVDPDAAAAAQAGKQPYYPETGEVVTDPPPEPIHDPDAETTDPKVGEPEVTADDGKEGGDDKAPATDKAPDPAPEIDEDGDFPFQTWMSEYEETGELSPESTQVAIDKIFHPDLDPDMKRQLMTQYLGGIDAGRGMAHLQAWDTVGGKESFDSIIEWARLPDSVPEAERAVFNQQLSGSPAEQKLALEGLQTRYSQAKGLAQGEKTPDEPDFTHEGAPTSGVPQIRSRQELAKIVGSDKYKTDSVYRAGVDAQVARSIKDPNYRTS